MLALIMLSFELVIHISGPVLYKLVECCHTCRMSRLLWTWIFRLEFRCQDLHTSQESLWKARNANKYVYSGTLYESS